jgi:DNA polymerase-1
VRRLAPGEELRLAKRWFAASVAPMAKWLLLDGYNLAFRAFYGMPELTRSDGFPTGALHGWVKSIWRLQDQEKPDAMLCFFDLGGAQDRLALHPEYKANRKETPEPLEKQMPIIKEITRAMGLVGIELEGVESDDLLASQARVLAAAGHEVWIVSADKDFAQVVNDRIRIILPPPTANPKLGWRTMDRAGVIEKFGVPPERIAEYLAIVGDTSDNIPGIDGCGPKTATRWLQQYGSLEDLIANASALKPDKCAAAVAARADDLRRNLKLTTLSTSAPMPWVEPAAPDTAKLFPLLESLEMKSTLVEAKRRYTGQQELF